MIAPIPKTERPTSIFAIWSLYLGIGTLLTALLIFVVQEAILLVPFAVGVLLTLVLALLGVGVVLSTRRRFRGVDLALCGVLLVGCSIAIVPKFATVREASPRVQSANCLKQFALAFHNWESAYGHMPPAAFRDKTGPPLYSWRVLILPYIEEDKLYREFHLDEPWDSPHNIQLLDRMPRLYRSVGEQPPEPNMTFYRVFVGPGTPFERDGLTIAKDFPDGTSNTILIIEAGEAVPWTKPDELEYHPDQPLPPLGGIFRGNSWYQRIKWDGIQAAMADGSVRRFERNTDEATLRAYITRNGGEKVP